MGNNFSLIIADLENASHADDILNMLGQYAEDIMGGGNELSLQVKQNLIPQLSKRTDCLILLAYDESTPIGLSIAFEGFSTFYAKPLLNIHDFVVSPNYRGKGIAKLLLDKTEEIARQRGYCKLTLEVLQGNSRAQKIYKDFGFAGYELDEKNGKALFWDKKLDSN
jgi:ribosomal protein S18 acetylase RimI-like enzyme